MTFIFFVLTYSIVATVCYEIGFEKGAKVHERIPNISNKKK